MVAFPRAVIVFCNLIHRFSTFALTFPSSLLKLSNFDNATVFSGETTCICRRGEATVVLVGNWARNNVLVCDWAKRQYPYL